MIYINLHLNSSTVFRNIFDDNQLIFMKISKFYCLWAIQSDFFFKERWIRRKQWKLFKKIVGELTTFAKDKLVDTATTRLIVIITQKRLALNAAQTIRRKYRWHFLRTNQDWILIKRNCLNFRYIFTKENKFHGKFDRRIFQQNNTISIDTRAIELIHSNKLNKASNRI